MPQQPKAGQSHATLGGTVQAMRGATLHGTLHATLPTRSNAASGNQGHEHSEAWQAERQRIEDEANRKRSAAADKRRGDDGKLKAEPVVQHSVGPLGGHTPPATAAKASASKTNAGAVARGDTVHGMADRSNAETSREDRDGA